MIKHKYCIIVDFIFEEETLCVALWAMLGSKNVPMFS